MTSDHDMTEKWYLILSRVAYGFCTEILYSQLFSHDLEGTKHFPRTDIVMLI